MQVNITVDDDQELIKVSTPGAQLSHYSTSLNGGWLRGSDCSTCKVYPNPGLMMNGTWHWAWTSSVAGSAMPTSFNITFPGTAIYVYGVAFSEAFLPANLSITQLTFALDGQPTSSSYNAKPWPQTPQNVLDFEYNTLVYSKTGLSNDTHILQITLPHISEQLDNAFIFDYAQYTKEVSSDVATQTTGTTISSQPTAHPLRYSIPTGTVAGITVVAIFGVVLLAVAAFCFLRRRGRRHRVVPGAAADLTPSPQNDIFSQAAFIVAAPAAYLERKRQAHYQTMDGNNAGTHPDRYLSEISALRAEVERLEAQNTRLAFDTQTLPEYQSVRTSVENGRHCVAAAPG